MQTTCDKCGRAFEPGDLKYKVRIELISMYDGYVEEPEGDVDEELERLIHVLSAQDPREAARDVAQTIMLVMCRECRNKLVREYQEQDARVFH